MLSEANKTFVHEFIQYVDISLVLRACRYCNRTNKTILTSAVYWQWVWPVSDRQGLAGHPFENLDDQNYGRKSMIKMYSLQNRFRSWTKKVTAPGLLTSAAGRTWGLWLAVHDVADVSLACTKFSSSKSPQSSHSPPRSAPTLGLCEDEAFLPWLLQFGAASEVFKQTVLLVLIWLRFNWWFWFALAQNPGFIHTVEPEQRNIAFRMTTFFDWRMKKLIKVDVKQLEYTIYTSCVYILRFLYCAFCTWKPKLFPSDLRIPRLFACKAASDWKGLSITSCMSSIP